MRPTNNIFVSSNLHLYICEDLSYSNAYLLFQFGRTALHIACLRDHQSVAEFLITANADVNIKDEVEMSSGLTLSVSLTMVLCLLLYRVAVCLTPWLGEN